MRAWRVAAALVAGVIGFTFTASEQPAHAALLGVRWSHSTVCVEDHAGSHWPVGTAVSRVDGVPDLRLVWRGDCSRYAQRIKVYEGRYSGDWYGKTYWWVYSGTNRLALVKIHLNDRFRGELSWPDRRSAIEHELLHGLGLAHTSVYRSLMNVRTWRRWDYPTTFDRSEIERLYPW